jgi:predicted N-formylglutamate amidohydrolase
VIDPNRGADDPTLLMRLSDGAIIPANRHADDAEVSRRRSALYDPYHEALAALAARREDTVIIAMHSFTPQMQGRAPRPWHVGVLWAEDGRYAHPLIQRLKEEADLCIGDNEPYTGYLPGDAIDTHATAHGRPNALIEIRNALIETDQQQRGWATRLAPILLDALSRSGV